MIDGNKCFLIFNRNLQRLALSGSDVKFGELLAALDTPPTTTSDSNTATSPSSPSSSSTTPLASLVQLSVRGCRDS